MAESLTNNAQPFVPGIERVAVVGTLRAALWRATRLVATFS